MPSIVPCTGDRQASQCKIPNCSMKMQSNQMLPIIFFHHPYQSGISGGRVFRKSFRKIAEDGRVCTACITLAVQVASVRMLSEPKERDGVLDHG